MSQSASSANHFRALHSNDFESLAMELRSRVFKAVRDTRGDSILLSGGLDTSIIVASLSTINQPDEENLKNSEFSAYTVTLSGAPSPDSGYSKLVSSRFGIPHKVHTTDILELEEALPEVISVLNSFDPMEIRNSVAVYIGMKRAKLDGRSKIMTGDGADELFAGYEFVFKQSEERARNALSHLWKVMHFSSVPLANSLGMEAMLPFLQPDVSEFAMNVIDFSYLTGMKEDSGELFGKYILRRAFEDMLPPEIIWRTKTPIEHGSGTTVLPKLYSLSISEREFLEKKKKYYEADCVRLRDREQLKYYEIYREVLGPPTPKDRKQRTCPACTSNVQDAATFCTTCGEYPI